MTGSFSDNIKLFMDDLSSILFRFNAFFSQCFLLLLDLFGHYATNCNELFIGPHPTDGERIANTTLIDALLDKDFQLVINDAVYDVRSPEKGTNTFLSTYKRS